MHPIARILSNQVQSFAVVAVRKAQWLNAEAKLIYTQALIFCHCNLRYTFQTITAKRLHWLTDRVLNNCFIFFIGRVNNTNAEDKLEIISN